MNGTFHLIQNGGEEIWLDGENIERLIKYDEGEDTSRFYVEVARKCFGIGAVNKPEIIIGVSAIVFYPNTKENQELWQK